MKGYCNDCKVFFEEAKGITEAHGERFYYCPFCGFDDWELAEQCPDCANLKKESEYICEDCKAEAECLISEFAETLTEAQRSYLEIEV